MIIRTHVKVLAPKSEPVEKTIPIQEQDNSPKDKVTKKNKKHRDEVIQEAIIEDNESL